MASRHASQHAGDPPSAPPTDATGDPRSGASAGDGVEHPFCTEWELHDPTPVPDRTVSP